MFIKSQAMFGPKPQYYVLEKYNIFSSKEKQEQADSLTVELDFGKMLESRKLLKCSTAVRVRVLLKNTTPIAK